MASAQITERHRYWSDHVLATVSHDGSIVEYADASDLKPEISINEKPR